MTASTVFTPGALNIAHGMALEEDAARSAPPPDPRRTGYMARLQRLAAKLKASPDIPVPHRISELSLDFYFTYCDDPRTALAACARAFGLDGWKKRTWEAERSSFFEMTREWDGWQVTLTAYRDAVCTKVVKGTEDREVEEVVQPAVTRTVTKPVDIIEWVCESVMAPAAKAAAA